MALTGCPFPSNTSQQCNANRTGLSRLCGKCKKGFGLSFQAEVCIPCESNYIARLMWIIFGIVAVAYIIIRYNIYISPKIRGVLFVLQNIGFFLFELPSDGINVNPIVTNISAILNLNFAFGLCIFRELNALESAFLGYLAPLLVMLMLIAAYVATSQGWMKELTRESRLNGLLTLVFLAYQSLATTSLLLLYCQPVVVGNGINSIATTEYVFFLDGSVQCWQGRHLTFGIIAIIVLVVLVLPLPIITFLVSIGKGPTRLRPFQDVLTFGHGFRPDRAWWFSVDLLRRLLVSVLFIFITNFRLRVVALEMAALFLLTLHLFVQPYVDMLPNLAEVLVLLDICIIGSLTIQQDERTIPSAIFMVLIILPIMYLAGYMLFSLWKRFLVWRRRKRVSKSGGMFLLPGAAHSQQSDIALSSSDDAYIKPRSNGSRDERHRVHSQLTPYAEVRASVVAARRAQEGNSPTSEVAGRRRSSRRRLSSHRQSGYSSNTAPGESSPQNVFQSMTASVDENRERLTARFSGLHSKSTNSEHTSVNSQLLSPLMSQDSSVAHDHINP